MNADPKLRFAVLAHQRGLIGEDQLALVCAAWVGDKSVEPAKFMLDRKWISAEQVRELKSLAALQPAAPGGVSAQGPAGSAASKTPNLDPNAKHESGPQTDEWEQQQGQPAPEGNKSAVKASDPTHVDKPGAAAEAHGHTLDFHVDLAAVPKDRERTDKMAGEQELSAGHIRKMSLETIDLKTASRSHYTLSRVHGKGGLGQVWLAIDGQLNREVALKELKPERGENAEGSARLIKEAQITGQLEHPNIIPVYELVRGGVGEAPFYTMRFMRGRTLRERIDDYHKSRLAGAENRLELRQLLSIFVGVCNALAYAHSRGVVHRDLKPHNVMLGDFGEVIVIDWGLAKTVDQREEASDFRVIEVGDSIGLEATMEGKVLGTPAFASPEQADGKVSLTDERSDIYGLGAILFMILTSVPPHRGTESGNTARDTMDLLRQISTGQTPRAKSVQPSAPEALDAIAAKAMSKERAQRYSKASELAEDVQRWLGDEPVSAYRDPLGERIRRWARRHRTWTQAAVAVLIAVTLVSAIAALFVNAARNRVAESLFAEQKALNAEKLALNSEREAKAEATRRFKEARDAVDKSLTGVSGVLLYYPGVQPLRTELLKNAAEDYERFANEKSDDLELRAESGRAFLRLGDVRQLLTQNKEAEQAYRSAESLFEKLSGIETDNLQFRLELARARTRLGSLYTVVGPHTEAERAFEAGVRGLDELVQQAPETPEYRYEKSVALLNRVALLKKTAKLADARTLLEQVEREFNQLTLATSDPKFDEALGATRRELGQLLGLMGRNEDAAKKIREAISVFLELSLKQNNHPPYLEGLAASRVDLANVLKRLGKDSDAIQSYRTSITDFDDLLHVRPDVPYYRENLALSQTNLAQILHTNGLNKDAKVECTDALVELTDLVNGNPGVHRYQEDLATTSATFGAILRDLNEDKVAIEAFRGAIDRFGELSREVRDAPVYRIRLALARSSMGRTLHRLGKHDDAKVEFLAAIEILEAVTKDGSDDPSAQNGLAWCYTHVGDLLRATQQANQATPYYARAMALREKLDKEPDDMHSLAWFLANCEDDKFRDPDRAVRVADEARKKAPENGRYWNMLGLTQYRAKKLDDSIKSLRIAADLRGETKHASDWFVLAMAHWQKGEPVEARTEFQIAQNLMDENCPGNIELGKLRREAADLIKHRIRPCSRSIRKGQLWTSRFGAKRILAQVRDDYGFEAYRLLKPRHSSPPSSKSRHSFGRCS